MPDFLFYLSTPLLLLSGMPQAVKLYRHKCSKSISKLTYLMTWLAVGILFADAIHSGNLSLSLGNGASFAMLTVNLSLIFYYA